jgi:hypothetical protein
LTPWLDQRDSLSVVSPERIGYARLKTAGVVARR